MARMHTLPFILYASVSALFFVNKALAANLSLPEIGSVQLQPSSSFLITDNKTNDDVVSTQLSLMGMVVEADFSAHNDTINDGNATPLFAIASQYHLTPSTQVGISYNNGEKNTEASSAINLKESESTQRETVELAVQHKFNNDLALIANANWKNWNDSSEHDNIEYDNTFGAGTALSYQAETWSVQTELSVDSNPVSNENNSSLLGMNEQWRLGFGGVKKINSTMSLGMSYQYQSIGHAQITKEGIPVSSSYVDDNMHFITTTLSF